MAVLVTTTSTRTDTYDGEAPAKTMTSRVNEAGAARIMSMVVNMYSDPEVAVVREYIANAVDATILAGTEVPVEVTVPSRLTPTLIVKDEGTGMSYAELEGAFLAFVESTKGASNDVVGGLGVGAKSAWTLCESFVVDTVKDGLRTVVRASRDLNHEVLVTEAKVDSPNGTTVTIPVRYDSWEWEKTVRRTAAAHPQGMVKVNGNVIKSIHGLKSWIGPVHPNNIDGNGYRSVVTILSGGTLFGVPLQLNSEIVDRTKIHNGLVIKLPVGSFEHTPSREHVIPSEITRKAIFAALDEFDAEHKVITRKINKLAQKHVGAAIIKRVEILENAQGFKHLIPLNMVAEVDKGRVQKLQPGDRRPSRPRVWAYNMQKYEVEPRNLYNELVGNALMVTDVPSGRMLRGIGRYMSAKYPTKRTVIALETGESSFTANVKMLGGTARGGEDDKLLPFTVTPNTRGITVISYSEMRAGMKELSAAVSVARVKPADREYSYLVYTEKDAKGQSGSATLSNIAKIVANCAEKPAVLIGTEDQFFLDYKLAWHNVVHINRGRRSENPIREVFPESKKLHEYLNGVVKDKLSRIDDNVVRAAILLDNSYSKTMFEAAARFHEESKDTEPVHALTAEMADVWNTITESADLVREAEKVVTHAYSSETYKEHRSALENMVNDLQTAYPLLRSYGSYGRVGEPSLKHVTDYVRNTPPMT